MKSQLNDIPLSTHKEAIMIGVAAIKTSMSYI